MTMRAKRVYILGATKYDGAEHRYVPYPLADVPDDGVRCGAVHPYVRG